MFGINWYILVNPGIRLIMCPVFAVLMYLTPHVVPAHALRVNLKAKTYTLTLLIDIWCTCALLARGEQTPLCTQHVRVKTSYNISWAALPDL